MVNSELKMAIESECVELFSNAPERREAPKLPARQMEKPTQQQSRPEIQD